MRKSINLISVPYDSAHFNQRMGAGPLYIVNNEFIRKLEMNENEVSCKEILLQETFVTEIASTFRLLTQVKKEITETIQKKSFPIVLSGNCCATVGVIAGINSSETGVFWFDAHGDCETPETTESGFLDGMGLSLLTNNCWSNLLASLKLNTPLSGKNIALIGARDLSEHEKDHISSNNINHITIEEIRRLKTDALKAACSKFIQTGIRKIHLHIDVDVIDPSVAIANSYSVDNGLSKEELMEIINYCVANIPVASVTIASYDPSFDIKGKMLAFIRELIILITKQIQ